MSYDVRVSLIQFQAFVFYLLRFVIVQPVLMEKEESVRMKRAWRNCTRKIEEKRASDILYTPRKTTVFEA